MESRTKNTKRNIVWGTMGKIISVLAPFILRTVLIYTLGIQYVGINGLFSSILQVLSLAELGFSSAIVYSMYKPLANNETEKVCALLNFYKKIYRIIGIIILGIGFVILPLLKYFIKGSYPQDINIYLVYIIYLLNTSISYFFFAYSRSLLQAAQRKDVADNTTTVITIVGSLLQIVLLIFTKNYYVYLILIPAITLASNVLCHFYARKMFPNYVCKNKLDAGTKNDIVEKTKGLLIYKVCGVTRNSLDNIFISMFLGITPVGIYTNYYYVMSSVRGFVDIITQGLSASIGNSVAVESVEKNYRDLHIFTFLLAWICGWMTVCLLCLYQPFMQLWAGKKNMFSFNIVIAFCIYFYVWTAGDIRSLYTDASGLWWKEKWRSIMETVSNVVLNYMLVQFFGVFGIVIATAISIAIVGLPWSTKIVFENYFKKYSYKKYLGVQLLYMFVTILNCFITYFVCNLLPIGNLFLNILVKLIICILIPNIIYFLVFFKTKIGNYSIDYVKTHIL